MESGAAAVGYLAGLLSDPLPLDCAPGGLALHRCWHPAQDLPHKVHLPETGCHVERSQSGLRETLYYHTQSDTIQNALFLKVLYTKNKRLLHSSWTIMHVHCRIYLLPDSNAC